MSFNIISRLKRPLVISKKTTKTKQNSWLAELTCTCAYLISSLSRMHYLSEQSCSLEQANHRKQMSINHIDPTGYWGGTSLVACMFILLTRGKENRANQALFAQFFLYSFTWNLFTGKFICFDQNMLQVRCIHLHFRNKVMRMEKYQRTNMKMKSSSAVIPTMKFILTDMFGQQTMDYYYKPKLKHGFQRSMWRVFNLKVMFQAFEQLC